MWVTSYLEIGRAGVRLTRGLYQTKGGSLLYRNQLTACLWDVPVSIDQLFKSATHFAFFKHLAKTAKSRPFGTSKRNHIKKSTFPSSERPG